MPTPATPSPFRLSRRNPPSTRRNAGPQFAPTPRFRLSRRISAQERDGDEIDTIDDDPPPPSAHEARVAPGSSITRRQRDGIEDFDDGELFRDKSRTGDAFNEIIDDIIDGTPPEEDPESPGLLDARFDAVFAPVRERTKRRRIDIEREASPNQEQLEPILSASPEPQPITTVDTPVSPETGPLESPTQSTPAVPAHPLVSPPGNFKTPFRNRPKFTLFSSQKQTDTQNTPNQRTPLAQTTPAPTQDRRKPTFILPRSPSPSAAAENIPAPFSPSSRTLHRRGKRAGVPGYQPGGMAAEVRSWILEMASKREQFVTSPITRTPSSNSADDLSQEELRKYLVAARVLRAHQSTISGSGPVTRIKAKPITINPEIDENAEIINVMVMGSPRSKPVLQQQSPRTGSVQGHPGLGVQTGDLIGIYQCLSWTLELSSNCTNPDDDYPHEKESWLVAMEWDLIQEAI
ncbi:hypothetical protein N7510_000362 [Penicillium lagena]|uniref:uncharacterized protein n=1 Tax=Penicillium lagena TaxID=94218 RepID=UPI00253FCA70|nr:uncharacterized protein N7510_000362 [Penicillium lagena]KAJ5624053.1 hypothetical protein N7510_000362 [Penicillium lagena]